MLHDVGNRSCFRQLAKDMHMVGNTADDQGWTLNILQNGGQISVCSLPEILADEQRISILCREDQMGEEVRQGLWHDIITLHTYVVVTRFQR